MTQKNLGTLASGLLLALGLYNLLVGKQTGLTFATILNVWLPVIVGGFGLWIHMK